MAGCWAIRHICTTWVRHRCLLSFFLIVLEVPNITGTIPTNGPLEGSLAVTILGSAMGKNSDVFNVTLAGVRVDVISWISSTQIVVWANAAPSPRTAEVNIWSVSHGIGVYHAGYTYNRATNLTNCTPSHGVLVGGTMMTITGVDIGMPLLSIQLGGVHATAVTLDSSTQIRLVTPAHTTPGWVSVAVYTYTHGRANSTIFRYNPSTQRTKI